MDEKRLSILKDAAEIAFGKNGVWLYETWLNHNKSYFGGELKECAILINLTPYGRNLGYYNRLYRTITLHSGLFSATSDEKKRSWVLLHEMMHAYLHQLKKYRVGDDPHFCDAWIEECTRVAKLIGLDGWFFCLWKRGKTKSQDGRLDVYMPLLDCPPDLKLAPRAAIKRFPFNLT